MTREYVIVYLTDPEHVDSPLEFVQKYLKFNYGSRIAERDADLYIKKARVLMTHGSGFQKRQGSMMMEKLEYIHNTGLIELCKHFEIKVEIHFTPNVSS